MLNRIFEIMKNSNYEYFGLRKDDFNYNIGDICNNSHELFQDPIYDENDELLYPYCEDGIYKGYYDAGELDGTCAIMISLNETKNEIQNKLEKMKMYYAKNLYLIGSNSFNNGNDNDEIIINNAIVIEKLT
jgi:hypothetical protein